MILRRTILLGESYIDWAELDRKQQKKANWNLAYIMENLRKSSQLFIDDICLLLYYSYSLWSNYIFREILLTFFNAMGMFVLHIKFISF